LRLTIKEGLMRKTLLATGILFALFFANHAEAACEECYSWFDAERQRTCKECVYSYCGFYDCVVSSDGWGDYCAGAWNGDDGNSCYSYEGIKKNQCGPEERDPVGALRSPVRTEWRLVRARVLTPSPRADRKQQG
jgi:hypothetical protein